MVDVNVCDLKGAALDWAVAKVEGWEQLDAPLTQVWMRHSQKDARNYPIGSPICNLRYSTDWSQGGPLIEKYRPMVAYHNGPDRTPMATTDDLHPHFESGETVLIAACRAIVAAKLGETVQVPAVLMEQ